jgi:hypothetical protein
MKKGKLFMLLFLIIASVAGAQEQMKNESLIDPNLNIVYIGVQNDIVITGVRNFKHLTLTSSSGSENKSYPRKGRFRMSYQKAGIDTLRLYKKSKLILEKIYTVDRFGDLKIELGTIKDTTATVAEILANPVLNVVIPNCYYNFGIRVIAFEMSFITDNNGVAKITLDPTVGNELHDELIEVIKILNKGDKLFFDNIKIIGNEICPRTMGSYALTIK